MSWNVDALKGKKVVGVQADEDVALLTLEGGGVAKFWLDGDCCSSSAFTDPHQFSELIGATIREVEDRNGSSDLPGRSYDEKGCDVASWHFAVFITDKGHVTIDWRNDSNGYYDGTIHFDGRAIPS